jgi:enterochelin esterase-like enzyme
MAMDLSLVSVWTLVPAYLLAFGLLTAVLWPALRAAIWRRGFAIGGLSGVIIGALLSWWLGSVENAADVTPSVVDRLWVIGASTGLGFVAVALIRGGWVRRVLAVIAAAVFIMTAGLAINRDAGVFNTVRELLGMSQVQALSLQGIQPAKTPVSWDPTLYESWQPPVGMPARGRFGSVEIPGTISGFSARPAIVYLPPAALVPGGPALPVVILMSGQGAGAAPSNVVQAGRIIETLDNLAAHNHGLAPIVVIPDQLGFSTKNPMCLDGRFGRSDTYLTADVTAWIRSHLPVQSASQAWAVGGFSQGGTCSIQLAASYPTLFRSFIDISGQLGPRLHSVDETINRAFDGNATAFDDAQPIAIMQRMAPYSDTSGFIGVGASDHRYGPAAAQIGAAAREAGMKIQTLSVQASSHDWATGSEGLARGLDWLMPRIGLAEK